MGSLTLLTDELQFPPLEQALAEPNGLLAMGGDLSAERLELAYRHGCFPWFNENDPILWWSPDPRMVLFPTHLQISRSMAKLLHKKHFQITYDKAFTAVIEACAEPRNYTDQTWISPAIQSAYLTLHQRGLAHSVEVWQQDELVGGLYGLAIGRLFFGESMFSKAANASKFGFIYLINELKQAGFALIDCQVYSDHLHSLGAELIPRATFATYLKDYLNQPSSMCWNKD